MTLAKEFNDEFGFCKKPEQGEIDLNQYEMWLKAIVTSIRARRKQLGFKQQDIADKTGISRATYSGFESGRTVEGVGFGKILKLCMLLRIDIFAEAPSDYYDYRYEELRQNLKNLAYDC